MSPGVSLLEWKRREFKKRRRRRKMEPLIDGGTCPSVPINQWVISGAEMGADKRQVHEIGPLLTSTEHQEEEEEEVAAMNTTNRRRRLEVKQRTEKKNKNSTNRSSRRLMFMLINLISATTTTMTTITLLTSFNWPPVSASTLADFDGATFYKAPVGSRIRIACNASNWQDDSVSLILWFKGSPTSSTSTSTSTSTASSTSTSTAATNYNNAQPIYTVDARQRSLTSGQARHLVSDAYRGRARFVVPPAAAGGGGSTSANSTLTTTTQSSPVPYLDLSPLEADDQGEFRCRVDYRSRPRENFLMILFVLVPPSKVEIMDSNGRSLEQIYGPLNEGSDLTLVCRSKGGRPPPALSWSSSRRTKVIDESYLTVNDYLALQMSAGQQQQQRRGRLDPTKQVAAELGPPPAAAANLTEQLQLQQEKLFSLLSEAANVSDKNLLRPAQWPSTSVVAASVAGQDSINSYVSGLDVGVDVDGGQPQPQTQQQQQPQLQSSPELDQSMEWRRQWSVWPEFDYFARLLGPAAAADQLVDQRHQTSEKIASQTNNKSELLLDFKVDDSITTAVNVLHIGELNRDLYASLINDAQDSQAAFASTATATATDGRPLAAASLQCHASNLHYDLRTLIKMFAPPSLVAGAGVQSVQPPPPSSARSHHHHHHHHNQHQHQQQQLTKQRPTGQLVGAIERALEASVRLELQQIEQRLEWTNQSGGGSDQPSQQPSQPPPPQTALGRSSEPLVSQIRVDSQRPADWSWQTTSLQSAWPSVIYQQVVRPHQLSAESGPAATDHHHHLNHLHHQQQQQQSALVRSKLIALDAYLRPLDVKIVGPQRPLAAASQPAEFTCTSSGSRPAARLSWLKNGRPLEASLWRQLDAGSTSTSKLLMRLDRDDHGAQLTCRAENLRAMETSVDGQQSAAAANETSQEQPAPPPTSSSSSGWTLEDSIILNVQYPPKLRLELGNKMLSEHIREGSDIYFVCAVDAQPPVAELTWLHDERPISADQPQPPIGAAAAIPATNSTTGGGGGQLIISNNSLVLQRVRINQRGKYTCMASNSEGVAVSNSIELRVLHAPICVLDQGPFHWPPTPAMQLTTEDDHLLLVQRLALPLKAQVNLNCMMAAEPLEGLHFTWYLNNSHNERKVIFESPAGAGNSNQTTGSEQVASSQLRPFVIESSLDYGRLYCEARNSIGQQKRACVYNIDQSFGPMSAGAASEDALNCLPVNVTIRSVWIGCHLNEAAAAASNGESPAMSTAGQRVKFSVLLHLKERTGSRSTVQLNSDEFELTEASRGGPTTDSAAANVFELVHLRPNSSYLLEVTAHSSFNGRKLNKQPELVQFHTEPDDSSELDDQQQQELDSSVEVSRTQIRRVSGLNGSQSADLVASALQQISTRSTNARDSISGSSETHLGAQRQPKAAVTSTSSLWSTLGRLFGQPPQQQQDSNMEPDSPSGQSNKPAKLRHHSHLHHHLLKGQSAPAAAASSNRLMDFASDSLLIGSMCLVLMITLISLLLIRRLAFRRSSPSCPSKRISCKSSPSAVKMKNMQPDKKDQCHSSSMSSSISPSSDTADQFKLQETSANQQHQHQEAPESASYCGSSSTPTIRMFNYSSPMGGYDSLQRFAPDQPPNNLINALTSHNMLATSSLQRRHLDRPRPASVQQTRPVNCGGGGGGQLLNNISGQQQQMQMLKNGPIGESNNKNVYGLAAGEGQVNVSRSRSSFSFGATGSCSSSAASHAPPPLPLPSRLIHLSGQPPAGSCEVVHHHHQQQQQDLQARQLLISDANAAHLDLDQLQQQQRQLGNNNHSRQVNDIDLSLGHQNYPPQQQQQLDDASALWLAPYIQVASMDDQPQGRNAHNHNVELAAARYQIMLPADGRCHVRGQQQQLTEGDTSAAHQQQLAGVHSQSDGSDSFATGAHVTCSCADEGHLQSGQSDSDYGGQHRSAASLQFNPSDFLMQDAHHHHHHRDDEQLASSEIETTPDMDQSSGHSNRAPAVNHHNQLRGSAVAKSGRPLEGGQPTKVDVNSAGVSALTGGFIRLIRADGEPLDETQVQVAANNLHNYTSGYLQTGQCSLSSASCSTNPTSGTGSASASATLTNPAGRFALSGSSPLSIESSGATLSQDQPIDLLREMGQLGGANNSNDNQSIDDHDDEHQSANSKTSNNPNKYINSRPTSTLNSQQQQQQQQQQQRHLASILKNSRHKPQQAPFQVDPNQIGNHQAQADPLQLATQVNDCKCNGNNNGDNSKNL